MSSTPMLLPNVYHLGYSMGSSLKSLITTQQMPSLSVMYNFIIALPSMYKNWWWNLVASDPVHVAVETTLLASVIYMIIISRNKDYRSFARERLSTREKEELLNDWKDAGRANLAPQLHYLKKSSRPMVVHSLNGRTMELSQEETNVTTTATASNTTTKSSKRGSVGSSDGEEQDNAVKSEESTTTVLNYATHDFLSMSSNPKVKDASRAALMKYGCGSCGPRGFYGTIDVHLALEEAISTFTSSEGAIMYSDGASTVSSTVAAFSKRGDLLVVDDGVYEPLVTGVTLSRANVEWFRHNDMNDLRRVLEKVRKMDKALGRKPSDQRRFIVAEGLYKNRGTICPLDQLVALKHEFNYRLLLDESFSFGTLGATGKGALELYKKRHMYDAELVTISLENALGSIGGVTVGNEEVVDHQRLSGAGYCFSASSPPFTASAAMQALEELETNPTLYPSLQTNISKFHALLKDHGLEGGGKSSSDNSNNKDYLLVRTSDSRSPIVFWEMNPPTAAQQTYEDTVDTLDAIVSHCLVEGVAMVSLQRRFPCKTTKSPAIRMTISAAHTDADLERGVKVLKDAIVCAEKTKSSTS